MKTSACFVLPTVFPSESSHGTAKFLSLSLSLSPRVFLILSFNSLVALEKNNEWLEYDQPREAYMRAVLDGMLWLENQQKDTNATLSQQHNQEHSDGEPEAHSVTAMREWARDCHSSVFKMSR